MYYLARNVKWACAQTETLPDVGKLDGLRGLTRSASELALCEGQRRVCLWSFRDLEVRKALSDQVLTGVIVTALRQRPGYAINS